MAAGTTAHRGTGRVSVSSPWDGGGVKEQHLQVE